MHHVLFLFIAAVLGALSPAPATAAIIDFSDAGGCMTEEVVILAGADRSPCVYSPNGMGWSGAIKRSSLRGDAFWTANFHAPVRDVSILLGDRSGDNDRLFLRVFGSDGVLLGETMLDSLGENRRNHRLALDRPGIHSATFGVLGDLGAGSGIFADNLQFRPVLSQEAGAVTPIPLPAASLLLLLGLSLSIMIGNRVQ